MSDSSSDESSGVLRGGKRFKTKDGSSFMIRLYRDEVQRKQKETIIPLQRKRKVPDVSTPMEESEEDNPSATTLCGTASTSSTAISASSSTVQSAKCGTSTTTKFAQQEEVQGDREHPLTRKYGRHNLAKEEKNKKK